MLLAFSSSTREQCDQMARWFVQYLAIYNNESLPNIIQIYPKYSQHFAKYQIKLIKIAKDFFISPNLDTLYKSNFSYRMKL